MLDYTYTTAGTVLRTSGKDDILNNSDDLLTTITFDNCNNVDVGETINQIIIKNPYNAL